MITRKVIFGKKTKKYTERGTENVPDTKNIPGFNQTSSINHPAMLRDLDSLGGGAGYVSGRPSHWECRGWHYLCG
ncbi:MAG: hypothetical protein FWH55_05260 [Oscillospiraceae bacterium]|nr:hypothetical protein [Oscillospiraceae bacterium]